MDRPLLQFQNITKYFSESPVLDSVSFSLNKGEILGIVGENGAGKSTLMSVLFGMPHIIETGGYSGSIELDGKIVNFKTPLDAIESGIGMVHQEFSLIPGFTATENILLNREITHSNFMVDIFGKRMSTLDKNAMQQRAQDAIQKLGVSLDANMSVSEMPVGHKQFTEIAREIDRDNVKVLVFDEPTAVLTESEASVLLKALKELARQGIAIIFISHRLREVMEICDRVVTLRDGLLVRDISVHETSIEDIASSMVGRNISSFSKSSSRENIMHEDDIFSVKNLWVDMPGETVRDVSFTVKKGEIFGIGGLAGQGKLGIANGIMGLFPSGGNVLFNSNELPLNSPSKVLDAGVSFVSEDRRGVGLLLDESIDWNISFSAMQAKNMFLKKYAFFNLRDDKSIRENAEKYIKLLEIKCTSSKQKAKELSGGNQQKVCLAKAFCLNPKLLFVSEPTRGIDVGAKSIVLDVLKKYNSEQGTTIIMISSELEELRSICDRIAIVSDGKIAGILNSSAEPKDFALLMSGESLAS
ncbi:MAG: sugar ABC transporter ATP-binding protein [Treponema sp.]|nr:sugar ABC transporter ATP-binding protein [Treponema sp.]